MSKVIMLGPSFRTKGGMTSVSKIILSHEFEHFDVEFLPTMHDNSLIGRVNHWSLRIITWPLRSLFGRPSLVHIHFAERLSIWRKYSLMLLWRLAGVPVVLHSHGSDTESLYPKMWGISKALFRRFLNGSKRIIVLSESWKNFYCEVVGISEEKVVVLENPVIIPEDFKKPNGEKTTLLYSGRIGNRKGAFDLIEAWGMIKEEHRERSELVIIGDGMVEEARRLTEKLGVQTSCRVLGWVDEDEKESLLTEAQIFVLPSKNEGLPMSLLEAMSYGLAPIVTAVGGIPDIITEGENGGFVEPGVVESIATKMDEFIRKPEKTAKMGDRARESVIPLGVGKYGHRLQEVWCKAIEKRG